MVELTPVGKITIAVVGLLIFYFLLFPLIMGLIFPAKNIERNSQIKIVAFLKTFDLDSAKLQETLRDVEEDQGLQGLVTMTLINIEAEPGKMEQNNVLDSEVPCFILGNQKFLGVQSSSWFKEKIIELADVNAE